MPFEPAIDRVTRLERCDGALTLGLALDEHGATRIAELYQRDPCRALFPQPEPDDLFQAVILTTSGGLAGGDCIAAAILADAGTRALVTTQAAEKIYRSRGDNTDFSTHISLGAGAWLEWLPQETILFDGARLRRETRIELAAEARLLAAELAVFGRTARGERITAGYYFDRWRVVRAGRLVWADALTVGDDPEAALLHPAGFAGALGVATIVYAGPDAGAQLAPARAALAATASANTTRSGASLVNGLLVARLLSSTAQSLRSDLAHLWCTLRQSAGNLPPRLPRTWYT